MGFFRKTLPVLFGVAFLGALGVSGYFVLTCIVERLQSVDFQVAAVTTSASVVVFLAAMTIARSIRQSGKQHTGHPLHAEKTAAYQLFLDLWGDFLRYGRTTEDRSPDTLSKELLALDRQLMLYGNAGVVNAYTAFRALERHSGTHNPQVRSQVARVIMEIRQDLGVGTQGLAVEELLPLLLAGADQASPPAMVSVYQDVQPRVSLAASS
jgi:hypothetical protein